jgi:uncharacterized repeat protein (TIGR03803 family)
MQRAPLRSIAVVAFAVIVVALMLASAASAIDDERVLYSFNGSDGAGPGRLLFDAAGNIYGTTEYGGSDASGCFGYGCGTAFQLTRHANGKWSERVLHSFDINGSPRGRMAMDAEGNLYGTEGDNVFELVRRPDGEWRFKVLYAFDGEHGIYPEAGVTSDSAGNLYGTTAEGGAFQRCWDGYFGTLVGCGVVFELTRNTSGEWKEKVLHNFNGLDGFDSFAGLTFDAAGNIYGATSWGGPGLCQDGYGNVVGCGVVFELTAGKGGQWTETVLHSFDGSDGLEPFHDVVLDAAGNVYGTTYLGGPYGNGIVFELSPTGKDTWTMTTLDAFQNSSDGQCPVDGPIFDAAGNLYGTTEFGGDGQGTIFELSPGPDGQWTETVLQNGSGSGLIFGKQGNLYGSSGSGGGGCSWNAGCGFIFEFTSGRAGFGR